jgi:hypothetical protein
MGQRALRGQTRVGELCQLHIVQAVRRKTARGKLLAQGFCAQGQFLTGLFFCSQHVRRSSLPAPAESKEGGPSPDTTASLRGRQDHVDVSFDEGALRGKLLEQGSQVVG